MSPTLACSIKSLLITFLSLLDELDEDLVRELDEVVRQNQLACLPFAKSGRAEAELIERHPGLTSIMEQGRRAKIDSIGLRSSLRDEDSFYANTAKPRPTSHADNNLPSSLQSLRQISPNERPVTPSNPLKQRASNGDLMFEMEEDDDQPGTQGQHTTASPLENYPPTVPQAPVSTLPLVEPSLTSAETPKTHAVPQSSNNSDRNSVTLASEYEGSPGNVSTTAAAWGSSAFGSSKLSMKEIMDQASLTSRTSNLSSGLALKARNIENVSNGSGSKLSQRERKRQQQQAQLQQQEPPASPNTVDRVEEVTKPTSPWQVAGHGPKVSLEDVLGDGTNSSSPLPSRRAGRQASAPALTLRQTIPGKASAPPKTASGGSQSQSDATPRRTVSTPSTTDKLSASALEENRTSSPNIRSIRHVPPPVEPSLQLSMADILAQQQTEKDVIKEAAAKRSLQEIQEEQAFQEWWDQESKKVQEEEEAAKGKTVGPRDGKSNEGRGRSRSSRGRGRGRGGLHPTEGAEQAQYHRSRNTANEDRGGKSRGRHDAGRSNRKGRATEQ